MNTRAYPTYKECVEILRDYGTPEHVIGHCRAVTHTSLVLTEAVNKKGYALNPELVRTAGMLHDIARVEDRHDLVGGAYLRSLGLEDAAQIVESHMTYPMFNDVHHLNETDIVCLGDRLCKFDRYVGLEERMEYILDKMKGNPKAQETILAHKKMVEAFLKEFNEFLGMDVDDLMAAHPLDGDYEVEV